MAALRSFLRRNGWLAASLLAASLCLKALTPAGFMIATNDHVLTVTICADATGRQLTRTIVIPGKGETGGSAGQSDRSSDRSSDNCPFSTFSMSATASADVVLLALALAFILALGFAARPVPQPCRATHVRPPLRGPPLAA